MKISRYSAGDSKIENRFKIEREISEKLALQINVTLDINSVSTDMSDPRWKTAGTDLRRENMIGAEVPDQHITSNQNAR